MSKIDDSEILAIMKRGFQAPVELTRTVHFNPKYPEYHNIYIPKINERYGMIYINNNWNIIDREDLVDDIYENKRAFIIQNLDKFIERLNEFKKKSLLRWLDINDNQDESIINTKNDIKKLLYNNRHIVLEQNKKLKKVNNMNKINKANEKKPLEIIELKKKKYDTDKESYSDGSSDSDSSYISNYSYVKSEH